MCQKIIKFIQKRNYFTYVREPSMPLKGKQPKWCDKHEDAFEKLESGQTVFCSGAAATPVALLNAMTNVGKQKKLKDITVCTLMNFNYHKQLFMLLH